MVRLEGRGLQEVRRLESMRRGAWEMTDQELIDKHIEPNPDQPGLANARVREYGVSVSALAGYLEAVHGDVVRVADDYRLPVEAVEAALAYYRRHKALIDDRLEANAG